MADGKDRISELPDEILLCILCFLQPQEEAARTIAISKRWRSVWRSYPIVKYNRWEDLQEFCDASINRFSRDGLLRMKILKLEVLLSGDRIFTDSLQRAFEQLFYLALERKAEEVTIKINQNHHSIPRNCFTFRLILNSALKNLRLKGIQFNGWNDQLHLSQYSLRTLCLDDVKLDGFYTSLITSSPLLETLELRGVIVDRKLEISNLINLKTIEIRYCDSLDEINITAPRLETLSLCTTKEAKKIELTAPQLHSLKIFSVSNFRLDALISNLESLKSLTLCGFDESVTKLKFSSPNLEELKLLVWHGLREIDLDCGPRLTKFVMWWSVPWELQECRISNAPACQWMLYIDMYDHEHGSRWFVQLREFVHRFTRFEKVDLRLWVEVDEVRFEEDEVDRDVHPVSIKELDISTASSTLSDTDYRALFDGLFWACRPRLIVIFYEDFITWDELIEVFLSQCLRKDDEEEGFKGRCNWRRQLKDVKIETVREFTDMPEHDIARPKDSKRVWFHLTWY
ncbi:Putative F-box/LRR-repeat protein At3g18150 [Linum perenne]